jgi:ubiquinone/menaquinone biosynthesis C-methylase UbiE
MVDVYHEFDHPFEMVSAMVRALRPGGRMVLVEFRGEQTSVPIKPLHKMTEAQVRREMEIHGLEWVETRRELPWQHVVIFRKPAGR